MGFILAIWAVIFVIVAVIVLTAAHADSVKEDNPRRRHRRTSEPASGRAPRVAGASVSFSPSDSGAGSQDSDNPVYVGNSSSVVEVHNFRNASKEKNSRGARHGG
ncbi:MAG: hypothetical protein PUF97_00375 [Bifidobacteriaceae bacterium]|nr:hypothetical protein [Bifidobacteriaceae bacterium]